MKPEEKRVVDEIADLRRVTESIQTQLIEMKKGVFERLDAVTKAIRELGAIPRE